MDAKEMKEKYYELYDYMSQSKNPDNMKVFGKVMNEMMEWMVANKPDIASDEIDKLESIKWRNYLTHKEAEKAVSEMEPKAIWPFDQWLQAMDKLGIVTEESPYYNKCALWATMSMIYSDSAATIAGIMGKTLSDVTAEEMVKATHALAIDKLKDADKNFSIRRYMLK